MPKTRYYRHGPGDYRPYLPERAINPRFGEAPNLRLDFAEPVPIPGTDEAWGSRSDRREYMNRHGLEEVGDAAPSWLSERQYAQKHGASEDERFGITKDTTPGEGVHFEFQDFGEGDQNAG